MRVALGVEYDGTRFSGWARQHGARSVAEVLEDALEAVAARPVSVVCAGRTDAGVHAIGQVVHFDTDVSRPERAWTLGVNTRLPDDVSVRWACRPGEEFHARFSAFRRHYRYVIYNHETRSPLLHAPGGPLSPETRRRRDAPCRERPGRRA